MAEGSGGPAFRMEEDGRSGEGRGAGGGGAKERTPGRGKQMLVKAPGEGGHSAEVKEMVHHQRRVTGARGTVSRPPPTNSSATRPAWKQSMTACGR